MPLDASVSCGCARAASCTHPRGELARERIGSAAHVRSVLDALHQAGGEHARTLIAALQDDRAPALDAADAARALDELTRFREHVGQTRGLFLRDADTGATVREYAPARWGEFAWSAEVVLGLDPQGFFVRRVGGGQRFRAMAFEQHALPAEPGDPPTQRRAEFVNPATGARYASPLALRGDDDAGDAPLPARLAVELRMRRPEDVAPTLAALERVLRASVVSGNPVVWG